MLQEDAEKMQKRMMEAKFDFNDFLTQTRNLARMGSMSGIIKLIPGMNKVLQLLQPRFSLLLREGALLNRLDVQKMPLYLQLIFHMWAETR